MEYDLSYLIRMGAGKHPQGFFGCFKDAHNRNLTLDDEIHEKEIHSTCAMGAAAMALSSLTGLDLFMAVVRSDRAATTAALLGVAIRDLNDHHSLTREEIADRLDALPGGSPTVVVP